MEAAKGARRARTATRVVGVVTACFALLSVRQLWVLALPGVGYAGKTAMSAKWVEPPDDEEAEWLPSDGQVPPPPKTATRAELLDWLKKYYPVLALDLPANVLQAEGSKSTNIDLGGGPPRRLYVEPGRGLVARPPGAGE